MERQIKTLALKLGKLKYSFVLCYSHGLKELRKYSAKKGRIKIQNEFWVLFLRVKKMFLIRLLMFTQYCVVSENKVIYSKITVICL